MLCFVFHIKSIYFLKGYKILSLSSDSEFLNNDNFSNKHYNNRKNIINFNPAKGQVNTTWKHVPTRPKAKPQAIEINKV